MILPGDELTAKLCHTGMLVSNIVVSVETFYVFMGQGSQESGMGIHSAHAAW
jgi:hypothetical protein